MNLSVIIITKNEEKMITDCLKSVSFADEVIVIDSQSTDETVKLAKKVDARVFVHQFEDFADQRNFGLHQAKGQWVLYVDADERVSGNLKDEILEITRHPTTGARPKIVAYRILRKNYYLGYNQWPMVEKIERLFFKKALKGWRGPIHESPLVEGKIGELKNFLLHYTHQDLESMVKKTNQWSEVEVELLFKSGHPKMTWWRFLRIMLLKFWQSFFGQGGWRVGVVGLIESIYQAYSYFIIYAKLWEKQEEKLKAQMSNVKTTT